MRKKLYLLIPFFLLLQAGELKAQAIIKPRDTTITGPQTFAMIMGISKYKYVRPLNYADKDALMFRDFLRSPAGGKVSEDNIYILLNEQATLASFYSQGFKWLKAKNLQKGDRLFIYLAGHGDAIDEDQFFYLAYDCNPAGDKNNYLVSGAIQMYNVKVKIQKEAAKGVDVFLIMDACRTNELPGGAEGQGFFNSSISEKRAGEIIMLATGAGQESLEDASIGNGHGLFTWYLVDGLSGMADAPDKPDKTVTVGEIQEYVQKNVPTVAKERFKRKQDPYFCCTENSEKVVSMVDETYLKNWLEERKKSKAGNSYHPYGRLGAGFRAADTSLVNAYNLFTEAIRENRLVGKNSADYYYSFLERNYPGNSYTDDAQSSLLVEFINFAQSKINLYLDCRDLASIQKLRAQVDEDEKTDEIDAGLERMEKIARLEFYEVGYMLERAVNLIEADDPEFARSLRGRMFFFKARGFFSNRQVDRGMAFDYAYAALAVEKNAAYVMQTLASLHLDARQVDSAVVYARRAIRVAPRWRYPYVTLAVCYKTLQIPDSALKYYRKSIELNPDNADSYVDLGHYFYSKGAGDSALVYYQRAIELEPVNVSASNNIGWIYHDRKQFERAIGFFKQSIASDPRFLNAYNGLAKTFAEMGAYDSARIYYTAAFAHYKDKSMVNVYLGNFFRDIQLYDSAIVYYRQAIELDPTYEDAYNNLGRANFQLRRYDSAHHYYRQVLELNPYSAQAYLNIGLVYRELKKVDSTVIAFQKAIRLEPNNPAILNNLGVIYIQDRQPDSAKVYFRRALWVRPDYKPATNNLIRVFRELNQADSIAGLLRAFSPVTPGSVAYFNEMGKIFTDMKRFDSARIQYGKALQLEPKNVHVLNNMAMLQQAMKRNDSARVYLQRAREVEPDNTLIQSNLALVFRQLRQYDSAAHYFTKQLFRTSGPTAQAWFSAGNFFYEVKFFDSSLVYYRRALALQPKYPEALANMASCFIQMERYDSALYAGRQATQLDSLSQNGHLNVGLSYHALGKYDSAIVYLKRLITLDTAKGKNYFRLACSYALNRQESEAIRSIEMACLRGYKNRDELLNDPDLSGLRNNKDFEALLDKCIPGWRKN